MPTLSLHVLKDGQVAPIMMNLLIWQQIKPLQLLLNKSHSRFLLQSQGSLILISYLAAICPWLTPLASPFCSLACCAIFSHPKGNAPQSAFYQFFPLDPFCFTESMHSTRKLLARLAVPLLWMFLL